MFGRIKLTSSPREKAERIASVYHEYFYVPVKKQLPSVSPSIIAQEALIDALILLERDLDSDVVNRWLEKLEEHGR